MESLYLHGFATGPEIWQDQPVGVAPELSFHDLVAEGASLADKISQGTVIVGWSMGGMLALKIAELAPGKVKALILVSTTPKFLCSADFPWGLAPSLLKKLTRQIALEGTGVFHDLIFKSGTAIGAKHLPLERVNSELHELSRIDLRPGLSHIKVPTLIIQGAADEICLPAAAEYLNQEIKGSRLIMFPGVAHAPMLEVKEQFNEVLREFLNSYA